MFTHKFSLRVKIIYRTNYINIHILYSVCKTTGHAPLDIYNLQNKNSAVRKMNRRVWTTCICKHLFQAKGLIQDLGLVFIRLSLSTRLHPNPKLCSVSSRPSRITSHAHLSCTAPRVTKSSTSMRLGASAMFEWLQTRPNQTFHCEASSFATNIWTRTLPICVEE